jgi:tripeptidyl-peptidase-1
VSYVPQVPNTNKLGIAGYLGEFASQSDLKEFVDLFRPDAANANFSVVTVDGGINDQNAPGSEVRTVLLPRAYITDI